MIKENLKYDFNKKSLEIGFRIRKARIEEGLSQKKLGKILGLTHAAIGSYERGRLRITVDLLAQIAKIFKKPISFFYEEDKKILEEYEASKKPKEKPNYNLQDNLEFSLELSIRSYLKAYGNKDIDLLTSEVLNYIKNISNK